MCDERACQKLVEIIDVQGGAEGDGELGRCAMQLNDLLIKGGIDPRKALVFRHRPFEPKLRKVLPWLALAKPDVFNGYQQTQGEHVERAMTQAKYVASLIGHEPGQAMFVGFYKVGLSKPLTYDEYWKVPAYVEMKAYGIRGFTGDRPSILWFDLEPMDLYKEWKGRLIVQWPGPERSWWRWAHRNEILIHAIHEEGIFERQMPAWDELTLNWEELKILPPKWQAALSHWRGIYFIWDVTDGKGYVGSAYGNENLFGRWLKYAASGHGGNKQLRTRQPQNLRFSILQRVSPDMDADDVIRLESSWKDRLHTRDFGLNEN